MPRGTAPWAQAGRGAARLTWALALILILLVVQAQAQAHLLGHAGALLRGDGLSGQPIQPGSAGKNEDHGGDGHAASACLECLALSGIDMPLGGSAAAPAHGAAALQPPGADTLPAPDAPRLRPRCRAPPTLPSFAHFA